MIRFRLKERVADWEFKHGKKLTLETLAKETGIHRTTLSKIGNIRGYNTTTDNIDAICLFFQCEVQDLMECVPNDDASSS